MAGRSYTQLGRSAALAILGLVVALQGVAPVAGWNTLVDGYYLAAGSRLTEGNYIFIMQDDCNLVLYSSNRAIWASNTNGFGTGCYFLLQRDGNAVVYTAGGSAVFATGTAGLQDGPKLIILQCDGNVVLYNALGTPHWATNTGGIQTKLGLRPSHGPAFNNVYAENKNVKITKNAIH